MKNHANCFLTLLILGIFLLSSCKNEIFKQIPNSDNSIPNIDYDITDATTRLVVDVGAKIEELDNVTVIIESKKHISEEKEFKNSFLLDITLQAPTSKNVYTKFTSIPHHPIIVWDETFHSVIGFLEIIDLDKLEGEDDNKKEYQIKCVPEVDMTKTYSVHIEKENLSGGYGKILIYSPQSEQHNLSHMANKIKIMNHLFGGKIKDPRI
jgi:hypothetical protein